MLAARQIAEIDPYLGISIVTDGVTAENVERFLLGDDELGPASTSSSTSATASP